MRGAQVPSVTEMIGTVAERLATPGEGVRRRVINATGLGLHTNLGRAVLAEEAVAAVLQAARHPSALELDLEHGGRGDRDVAVRDDLCALTGAEDALVVNNNAAAVLLATNALASGREVIVSRGELVEIGGSFRMPDVMAASGVRLREVGTTNRTHARDYRDAIGPETALLMKVHPSNFRVVGFTASVDLKEVVAIAREAGLPVLDDVGSGALVNLREYGLPAEPLVRTRVEAGADLVTFSGDKLLGGPQAGLIVGRRALVRQLAEHPLRRALRPDKLTLAALAATLRLYRDAPDLPKVLPTLRWLTRSMSDLEAVGLVLAPRLAALLGPGHRVEVISSEAEVGSGAVPARAIESRALAVSHPDRSAQAIAATMRRASPPVLGRVSEGRLLLDLRGVYEPADLLPERL
jgi:L-seryl-tRNA(Ser) seleniumtransferase